MRIAALLLCLCAAACGQTNGAPAAPATPARPRISKFHDPLILSDPVRRERIDPVFASSPAAISNIAQTVGVVDSWAVTPHSNLGIRRGDLRATNRLIDPAIRPEWEIERYRRLADMRKPPRAPAATNSAALSQPK